MSSLTISNLRKSFGIVEVLKGVDLEARSGEFVALVGPSGCGKSTLLAMIAGLESVSSGEIRIDGRLVNSVAPKDRDIAMVFQSYALYPTMTVRQNITFGMESRRVPRKLQDEAVKRVSTLLQIEPLLHRKPGQLSGGQRQRVALARAVAIRPGILLLDEPLTALDAALRDRLRGELDRLLRTLGITTIYVTHDQSEAMALGDRIVVMQKGAMAQIGTPREIYFTPKNRFVAEFIGAANIVEAPVENGHLVLPGGRQPIGGNATLPAAVAMIRPETIRIVEAGTTPLSGTVDSVSFIGDRQRLLVSGATGKLLTIDAPNSVKASAGERIGLLVAPDAVRLLPLEG
jgi:putative spermidine/putrescine transport system ATP-binding protein